MDNFCTYLFESMQKLILVKYREINFIVMKISKKESNKTISNKEVLLYDKKYLIRIHGFIV